MKLYDIYNILASGRKSPTKNQNINISQKNLAVDLISFSVPASSGKQSNLSQKELHDIKNEAPPQLTTHLKKRFMNKCNVIHIKIDIGSGLFKIIPHNEHSTENITPT
ncbi:MAG: hypothetical protein V4732_16025 [Pseudomonadota bacterium]